MQRGKGKPFLEVLASALNEDYRFPILEIFIFLYALGTFTFASFAGALSTMRASHEAVAYSLTSSVLGVPLFMFFVLVLKNLAFGFGSDIEKGVIQTYLSYPLKKHHILSAKLLSAIGLALIILLGVQISALYLLAPDVVADFFGTVLLTYAANISPVLLISGIILWATLLIKRGGLTVVFGIIFYFVFSVASSVAMIVAFATGSPTPLKVISLFYPSTVLGRFYNVTFYPGMREVWSPTFLEVVLYIGASYIITAFVFATAYIYFCRRFSV